MVLASLTDHKDFSPVCHSFRLVFDQLLFLSRGGKDSRKGNVTLINQSIIFIKHKTQI